MTIALDSPARPVVVDSEPVVRVGMRTPWGRCDHCNVIIPGMGSVGTSGHGGIKLSRRRQALMPDYMRREGGWYEEDCDWCLPFIVFETEILLHSADPYSIQPILKGQHSDTFRNWHPDACERYTGIEIPAGQSSVKDERLWLAANASNYIVIAAWGAGRHGIPEGFVGVCAKLGGRGNSGADERYFLVPDAEYQQRAGRGFVVDPVRHPEMPAIG